MRFAALALVLGFAVVAPATALANCGPAANHDPADPGVSMKAERSATLCLLNAERRRRGEKRLRFNHRLAVAALHHASDMVDNQYFAHDTPSGEDFVQRIMNTHYVPASSAVHWTLGENLAWGARRRSTPRAIVRAWMHSPPHRRNILTRGFREIGVAIVVGAPVAGKVAAATYATEFGVLHRS